MAYIPEELYGTFSKAATALIKRGIPFAIGGGTALSTYTGHWRGTKDIDFYVVPADREGAIETMKGLGLADYYEELPYDRAWIYRSYNDDTIVDVIWAMANHSCGVDERWTHAGPMVDYGAHRVRLVPPEELIFGKMYVLQRDRCDWPDILNMFHAIGPEIDWRHMIRRVGADAPLLGGVLSVFCWLAPERAAQLPGWVLGHFGLDLKRVDAPACSREDLLDRRPWYVPAIPRKAA